MVNLATITNVRTSPVTTSCHTGARGLDLKLLLYASA